MACHIWPTNPSIGQTETVNSVTYKWTGLVWDAVVGPLKHSQLADPNVDGAHVASAINAANGVSVQDFIDSFALKIFQSPTDGLTEINTRTLTSGEVFEVRKTSDGSLATIYSDAAGTAEIVQNGTSNTSNSAGVVEFYIADGDYYVEANSVIETLSTHSIKSIARNSTLDEAIIGNVEVGAKYIITDLGGASYEVVSSGDIGGFYIGYNSAGNKLKLAVRESKVHVSEVGAKIAVDFDFNEIANYCAKNNITIDFSGGYYLTATTIDVSTNTGRILKIKGDVDDKNNVGIYNLVYTGAGTAIKCREVIHNRFGLAGTVRVADTIPASNTAIECSESFTHIDSCIRNFRVAYKPTGGFYHEVNGGVMRRCGLFYDISSMPLYNLHIKAKHSDFNIGVLAGGGNGPASLGGAWEGWTDAVFKVTTPTSQIGLHLDSTYFENYPGKPTVDGLSDTVNTYTAPHAIILGDGSLTGRALVTCNGITESFLDSDNTRSIDVVLDLINSSGLAMPTDILRGVSCRNLDFKASIGQGDFSLVNMVNPSGIGNSLVSAGSYTDKDGTIRTPSNIRPNEVLNGWTVTSGVNIDNGTSSVSVRGRLNASEATSVNAFELKGRTSPIGIVNFIATTNEVSEPILFGRVFPTGIIEIKLPNGGVPTASVVNFSVTYNK